MGGMAPDRADGAPQPHRSTWWVGRGRPSSFWLPALLPAGLAAWVTVNRIVTQRWEHTWVLVVAWVVAAGNLAWHLWCRHHGRDPNSARPVRWMEDHPVWVWTAICAFLLVVFLSVLLSD